MLIILRVSGAFKTEYIAYITFFEDTSDSIFHLLAVHKYKEDMEFINKLHVCDMYFMEPEERIIYEVHSTIIFSGSWVSDFTGNLRARRLNKANTK